MTRLNIINSIAVRNIRKWPNNPRILTIIIFLVITILWCVLPIRAFLCDVGIAISPWLFPFVSADLYVQVAIILCSVFLFSDAPFIDESAPYVIIRSGRHLWAAGQILYIFMASAMLVLFIVLLTLLPFVNRIEWTVEWGKAIGTISLTNAASVYNIPFVLYQRIIYSFSPVSAMGLSMLLNWMMCSLIGLIMFVFNMSIGHSSGSIICCTITMFNYFIANFLSAQWLRFSPISLSNIAYFDKVNITPGYALCILSAMIGIFTCAAFVAIHKKNLSVVHTLA